MCAAHTGRRQTLQKAPPRAVNSTPHRAQMKRMTLRYSGRDPRCNARFIHPTLTFPHFAEPKNPRPIPPDVLASIFDA